MAQINLGRVKGEKGDKGDTGLEGPRGPQGVQGEAGSDANVNSANIQAALGYTPTSVDDFNSHKNSTMPHLIVDKKTNKTYRYGYQISADGIPQVISEEVI